MKIRLKIETKQINKAMKHLSIEHPAVQSILHMVVNEGEAEGYAKQTQETMQMLSDEFFKGNTSAARRYIEAQLTIEVYEHQEEYCGMHANLSAEQLIGEMHRTLMGYLNTL